MERQDRKYLSVLSSQTTIIANVPHNLSRVPQPHLPRQNAFSTILVAPSDGERRSLGKENMEIEVQSVHKEEESNEEEMADIAER